MTLEELAAVPELDQVRYKANNEDERFTSASFVVKALKQLGLFHDDGVINANEFTVRDVYQLGIYEPEFSWKRPDACFIADYGLQFCQLFGETRMYLPGYNTIAPYEHMNENCANPLENSRREVGC